MCVLKKEDVHTTKKQTTKAYRLSAHSNPNFSTKVSYFRLNKRGTFFVSIYCFPNSKIFLRKQS